MLLLYLKESMHWIGYPWFNIGFSCFVTLLNIKLFMNIHINHYLFVFLRKRLFTLGITNM